MNKIVHIINRMEIGGVEVGVLSLLKSKEYNNYHVVTIKGACSDFIESLIEEEKERLHICNNYFSALMKTIRLKPDYIISSLWRAHIVSFLTKIIKLKSKRIFFIHNSGFGHKVNEVISKSIFRFANNIFCDSAKSAESVRKYRSNKRNTCIVPMNVSFGARCDNEFNNKLRFVYIGRYHKQKNILRSIEVIEKLRDNFPLLDVIFDLYGRDDGELNNLKKEVDRLKLNNHVHFHRSICPTRAEETLRNYSFYLQTSLYEGMSISTFQAMKNGLIPVVTPVGEIQNYSTDKINAFYLNENDIKTSVDEFILAFINEDFNYYKFGKITNSSNYEVFDKKFFMEIGGL